MSQDRKKNQHIANETNLHLKLCLRFKFLRLLRSNGSRDTGTQHTASLPKLLKTSQRSSATTDADSTPRPKPRPLTLNVPLPPPLTHSLPVVIETQKAPWLPPARQRRVHHCRRQPHATQPHLLYRQRFPPERRLRNVWCTRTPRGALACRVRSCAGSRGWISASSLGTSSGAEASQAPGKGRRSQPPLGHLLRFSSVWLLLLMETPSLLAHSPHKAYTSRKDAQEKRETIFALILFH